MVSCPKCGAELAAHATTCAACGASVPLTRSPMSLKSIYAHIPHPHIQHRKKDAPKAAGVSAEPKQLGPVARFNAFLAIKITNAVGTMWCAYLFAGLAFLSLPDAIKGGVPTLVSWTAQTFLQLVLLSIIIVGQKVSSESTDKRADNTYKDAEAILHESIEIQKHLAEQDAFLQKLIHELVEARPSAPVTGSPDSGSTTTR